MSAITSGRLRAARDRTRQHRASRSIVAGTVESCPSTTIAAESPTRIELDAGLVGDAPARGVVGGHHRDLLAAALQLEQLGQRQLAVGPDAYLLTIGSPSRTTLSIRRVAPTRTAAARTRGLEVGAPRRSRPRGRPARLAVARRASAARQRGRARSRSSGERSALRDDSARPSASRTVGSDADLDRHAQGREPSRRTTATCCASFWPKYARCGRTRLKSFRQTVATPRKWPGRCSPSSMAPSCSTSTQVWKPGGYISSAVRGEEHVDARLLGELRRRAPRRAGTRPDRRPRSNWAGLTNRLATTSSFSSRAARKSARWPSWSAPIVGTRPISPSSASSSGRSSDDSSCRDRRLRRATS